MTSSTITTDATIDIELSAPVNLRDLGGIPIAGGVLRSGFAIRTDDLSTASTEAVTAGGWRTPETVLTERFRPSAASKRLTITSTWQDPKVYIKPHTYEIVAERTPPGSWAFEGWCDSSDPNQRLSIVPPAQK